MTTTAATAATTGTLEVPDARLHYEVRGTGPALVLVGAPMDAVAFEAVADQLATDHTVVTTDPRGINRSVLDDPEQDSTPELRADDLARLLTHLGCGSAAVFGSSGGAVTALALAQSHPELVHTVVAHEPPLEELLEDREERRAITEDIIATFRAEGSGPAWGKFLAAAGLVLPDGDDPVGDGPAGPAPSTDGPDASAGPPAADPGQAETERRFFLHELRATTHWEPDLAALRDAPTRIVVAIGSDSTGQICDLTSRALAGHLGTEPTIFPGDHTGFVDDPEAFAAHLRTVLAPG